MPRCNSVLQTEKDPFPREIRPNFPENCHFSTFFRTPKSSKTFGHFPVNNTGVIVIVFMWEKEFIVRSSPAATPPYQPNSCRIGMGGIIASFKKTDLFKQKSINPTISHAPNIPISETVVTTDQQRMLNKRGKVEYGPVGFGIRVETPNGPRPTPQHWKHYAPESL